jgi:hypothetical protein
MKDPDQIAELNGWSLWRLDPQQNGEERWSIGKNGPHAYLTCDAATALEIHYAVASFDALREIAHARSGLTLHDLLRRLDAKFSCTESQQR